MKIILELILLIFLFLAIRYEIKGKDYLKQTNLILWICLALLSLYNIVYLTNKIQL